ncbi:uncharacterized protein PHALS_10107 [Plasmopara halstedii]|uniref:Uncharacterized protein n=1 Tax=Plasmopara halstedii TaxID=4781 RepID=A0A0P1AGQ9_PLAHL|nr:uncharacterized protein PHALS_10107 [Plasmopara halstedii]CEG39879.1 hypothetical protein PHALS_10107 [Plasmopara halstedii]|eukprot:XP_024576248.1 hypothetical protein PHALS_10107 [Plasmopara halstedii]
MTIDLDEDVGMVDYECETSVPALIDEEGERQRRVTIPARALRTPCLFPDFSSHEGRGVVTNDLDGAERRQLKAALEKFDEIEEAAGNGPVNVLVVVREGADGLPTKTIEKSSNDSFGARDNSDDWLAKRIEYHSLPSIASLPKFIEHSLPVKIRMNPKVLSVWSSFPGGLGTNVREKLFAVDDVKSCEKIRRKIENMLEPLRSGDTEKSFIWFWDTMIRALLDLMFVNARLNRDTNHQSSTAKQRADFMFFLNEVCVFRGEEKQPAVD